jgi:hypothetical protein
MLFLRKKTVRAAPKAQELKMPHKLTYLTLAALYASVVFGLDHSVFCVLVAVLYLLISAQYDQ